MEQTVYPTQPKSKATTAMVLGITALVLSVVPLIGLVSWVLAPLAIFFGIRARGAGDPMRGQATAGVVTGGIALLICLIWLAATVREVGRTAERGSGAEQATGASAGTPTGAATPAGMARFVNTRENARTQNQRDRYVDFSFEYPANWEISRQRPNGENFGRVAAPIIGGIEPYAFHIGSAAGTGNAVLDQAMSQQLVAQISPQYASLVRNYTITSHGPQRVGRYDSYGWRFTGNVEIEGETVQVFGRGDVIIPPGQTRGVTLLTLVTSRTDEVRRVEDIGEAGTLRALFDSLRIGPDA